MTADDLKVSRVLVTGATGFLGRHLHRHLVEDLGVRDVTGIGGYGGGPLYDGRDASGYNLFDNEEVDRVFAGKFDLVFHLAGFNGGIQFNEELPADIFFWNTLMGLQVVAACVRRKVKKLVGVVASCAYGDRGHFPEDYASYDQQNIYDPSAEGVMVEGDFFRGRPNPSVAGHAYAKRNLQLACSFARKQYGLNAVCVCPTTLYGPGDSYNPEKTKVMGAMVKRFADAVYDGATEVTVWGSGRPMREFLYVEDAARLLAQAMLKYEDSDAPLNLGTGQELSVRQVAEMVAAGVQFYGNVAFDTSRPDGQYRKRLDLTRMREVVGEFEPTPLPVGIARTVADYRSRKWEGAVAA